MFNFYKSVIVITRANTYLFYEECHLARFKEIEHLNRNCCSLQKFVRPKLFSTGFGGLKFINSVAFGGIKYSSLL